MNSQSRGKIFVGLSGGVDSAVSAALLKEAGFDVTGVFIKVWQPDWFECTWREDRLDAMRVCVHLGIPFETLDLENEYKKEVVDYMVSEYKAGRTPNPDVMCNKHVKFGGFFDWAMKKGADFVATGHYARIDNKSGAYQLLSGKDTNKDQSYFLWTLTQHELSKIKFPVGGLEKSQTRRLAETYSLPVAQKKDSQGLCFIGKVNIREFLEHYIPAQKGAVLDEAGNRIGEHDGAIFLTLGERHGFRVTTKTPDEKPYFIISRNLTDNTITVSHKSQDGSLPLEKKEYRLSSINWNSDSPESDSVYKARVRHLGELLDCSVELRDKELKVSFRESLAVASGQSIVIYLDNACVGGGIVL
jgi:tRNA-uridine 2-sulfurtransferase